MTSEKLVVFPAPSTVNSLETSVQRLTAPQIIIIIIIHI